LVGSASPSAQPANANSTTQDKTTRRMAFIVQQSRYGKQWAH
jgi:hypothetical protein